MGRPPKGKAVAKDKDAEFMPDKLKTKPIKKSAEESEDAEKEKHKVKRGRPKEDDKIEVKPDPTSDLQEILLEYWKLIGLKHGLVFRPEDRELLAKQNYIKTVKWTPNHEWDEETELKKLNSLTEAIKNIEQYEQEHSDFYGKQEQNNRAEPQNSQWQSQKLQQIDLRTVFLNIGNICAQEFTEQVYILLSTALRCVLENKKADQLTTVAETLFSSLRMIVGKFTELKIQYWIEISKNKEHIRPGFLQMFPLFTEQLERILNQEQRALLEFLAQQAEMKAELQMIIEQVRKGGSNLPSEAIANKGTSQDQKQAIDEENDNQQMGFID